MWLRMMRWLWTVRYLRPKQIAARLWFKLYRPRPDLSIAPGLRLLSGQWHEPVQKRASLLQPLRFRFLNVEHELSVAQDWNNPAYDTLWLYNLHYFDDLSAESAISRLAWHQELLRRWVAENPPARGIGWAPYPTSLRIINWIKWSLAGNYLSDECLHSLAVQTRWLMRRLEYHLLGNHLFANAKALVFAGLFFEGREANAWLYKGLSILEKEIPEQILSDGGQFERSPMYHALAYEDLLDLFNITIAYPEPFVRYKTCIEKWPDVIERMGYCLAVLCHPDGEISFFNDAAMGIAPHPSRLFDYSGRLGFNKVQTKRGTTWLQETGYIRVECEDAVLFIDAAPVGPDYLPGHAHADTLSYELSIAGQRVIVNTGTSRYGTGVERERERATAAHNTLEIDGENSSEVWAGFRVAQRAYPFDVKVDESENCVVIEAAHDGYRRLPGRPVHRRRWVLGHDRLDVFDLVEGDFSKAISRVHFHPAFTLTKNNRNGVVSWSRGELHWTTDSTTVAEEASQWHPEFGVSQSNYCLSLHVAGTSEQNSCMFSLEWN